MLPELPDPPGPPGSANDIATVPPAGPFWRIWHPSTHITTGDQPREYGPLARFDPHPAGPPRTHPGIYVLYGSLGFEVSALEVFNRSSMSPPVVQVCPAWRASLMTAPVDSRLFDHDAADSVGATVRLGDTDLDESGYGVTQQWGRWLHSIQSVDGVRYLSCRSSDRRGIALALYRTAAIGPIESQHRLIDDALWRYVVWTLDSVNVAVERIATTQCGRCS